MKIELTANQAQVLLEFIDPDPESESGMLGANSDEFEAALDDIAAKIREKLNGTTA
jgi:hypothetical protein